MLEWMFSGINPAATLLSLSAIGVSLWIAYRSGRLNRPKLRFGLGASQVRTSKTLRPTKHLLWLCDRNLVTFKGWLPLPVHVLNESKLTIKDVKIHLQIPSALLPNADDIKELLAFSGKNTNENGKLWNSREVLDLDDEYSLVSYSISALHPGEGAIFSEPLKLDDIQALRPELSEVAGFDKITNSFFDDVNFGALWTVNIAVSGADHKVLSHTISCACFVPEKPLEDLLPKTKLPTNKVGERWAKYSVNTTDFGLRQYVSKFWLGEYPGGTYWSPYLWALQGRIPKFRRLARKEQLEVLPMKKLKKKDGFGNMISVLEYEDVAIFSAIFPNTDYYLLDKKIDTHKKLLKHLGYWKVC